MLYHIKNLLKSRPRDTSYRLLIRSLAIRQGDRIALTGPSGCGKSTTLDILGLSLAPDSADAFIFNPGGANLDITALWQCRKPDALARLRGKFLGYVLQSGELLPFLTIGENISFMGKMAGLPEHTVLTGARELAEQLGIGGLWNAMPDTLSVGERQRAAIARALAARPEIIIADEPTAALDPAHASKVMEAFLECVKSFGSALILATHDADWALQGGLREIGFRMEENADGLTAIVDDGGSQA